MSTTLTRDARVREYVVDEITFDPAVMIGDIAVIVRDGVVTLTGVADSYGTRAAAETAAWRVSGVREVIDQIVVNPEMLGRPTDLEMAATIRKRIENSFLVPPKRITVAVQDGVVTLRGAVDLHLQREAAFEEAAGAKGVRDVINYITINRHAPSPTDVASEIKKALVRNAQLDAQDIHVTAEGSTVTLTGTVDSYAAQREAEAAAWRARGTARVINNITIRAY